MSRKKEDKQNKETFGMFAEKAVTPDDGIFLRRACPEQTTFEAQQTFIQDYSMKRYYKLTKGLWVLIAAITIFLVSSVFLILFSTNKNLFIIHTNEATVARYELHIGQKERVWIKDVMYLGPYTIKAEYNGMEGKTALLAKFIDRFDADMLICGEDQVYELAQAGYIASVGDILGDETENYSDVTGIGNDELYGYKIYKGLKVIGTLQVLKLNEGQYLAVTRSADSGRAKKSVLYFLEYYYDKQGE